MAESRIVLLQLTCQGRLPLMEPKQIFLHVLQVHISGSPEAVQIASALIQQKVAAAAGPPRAPQ